MKSDIAAELAWRDMLIDEFIEYFHNGTTVTLDRYDIDGNDNFIIE